tara:strand:+ start:44 stop:310 length:267 start_codon:yes stop_codon:yes gene_type:complete
MKREELYRLEKEYNYKSLCVQYEIDKNKLKKDNLIKIFSVVFKKLNGHELSVAHKISKKYHLDFIDWNKYENQYVVIVCKNKINLKTN